MVCSPAVIFVAAFVFRMVMLYLMWRFRPWFLQPVGAYGREAGCVAKSIAEGKGFSSPSPWVDSGPTAWLCPVFPYLLAGIFKLWGIYSLRSHIAIQVLNCLFSALTVFPIYGIGKRTFGAGMGVVASWLWVVLYTAWYLPIVFVWDLGLSALWFTLIFLATLALRGRHTLASWAGYGVLWAAGALIDASFLSLLPFFLGWLVWEARKRSAPWLGPAVVALAVIALGVSPWTLRNYRDFGKFIPVRSNFGLALWFEHHPGAVWLEGVYRSPFFDGHEARIYQQMGEAAYMTEKKREAYAYIRSHPGQTVQFVLRGFGSYWFSVTDRPKPWFQQSKFEKANFVFNAAMILLAWFGAVAAWRLRGAKAAPFLLALLIFPLVYYLTNPLLKYRFPLDPILALLAVYGTACVLAWLRGRPLPAPVER